MKIGIISGSHRANAQSLKVANHIKGVLDKGLVDESWLYSLSDNPLPLWDQGVWDGDPKWDELLIPLRKQLTSCDGFVIISPEWHGQVPAGLKNFFLLVSRFEIGHKPALIVSVSSGDGGSYPVAELRMSSYKNNRLCYIPEHLIIRHVENVLNDVPTDNDERSDTYYRERIEWSLGILKEYAIALQTVRDSGATETDKFKNGM
ncbi:MAG: NAD(P)H-dependent oxidoreductase [Gammaproteobacteria bacterium]|nr:NAD(P)H-dependent oxidoreductase [Gammaproteobacteria bacterium]MDH5594128.1 NAD(P)H-dependent oxidoreductase [Gammaproteobacteria bacterium]MDH5613829.1 NAD(P)H-dependent oxidoreductase [Gammaproteobacteria bacterium]